MTARIFLLALLIFPRAAVSQSHAAPSSAAFAIAGTVVDAVSGRPLPRAQVSIFLQGDETAAMTDPSGRFRFTGLEPGKYQLFAGAPGYVHQGLDQHGSFFTGVVAGEGLDTEHVLFRLSPQAVIHGRVADERGDPVRHAQVQLFSADRVGGRVVTSMQAQTQTDDLGQYRFPHLLAGKYYVVVQAQPWYAQSGLRYARREVQGSVDSLGSTQTGDGTEDQQLDVLYPVTFYPGVTDEHSAGEINLGVGSNEEADVSLLAIPALHIRLVNVALDERNAFNVMASQELFGTSSVFLPVAFGQISPNEFELAGLPPGDITLAMNRGDPGDPVSRTFRVLKANLAAVESLDLSSGGVTANVSGRVIWPSGGDFPDGALVAIDQRNLSPAGRVQKDGSFSLPDLPNGTYQLTVLLPGRPAFVQKVTATGAKVTGRQVHIDGTRDVQLNIFLAQGVAQLNGVASLHDRPAAGIMILLVPESGEWVDDDIRMDQSDSDGTFSLGNIVPGKYLLFAIQEGWSLDWHDPAALKSFRTKAQPILVEPGETKKVNVDAQSLIH